MALVTTPTIADGTNKIFRSDFTIPSESHLRVILSGGTPPNTDTTTTTVAYVYNDFILSSTTAKIYKAIGTTSIGDLLTDTAKFEERVAYEQDVLSNQFDVINNSVVFHDTDIPTNGITVYVNVASTPDELTDSPSAIAQIYANLAEILTADDNAILTAADVVSTNADVVLTNADVVATNADVVATNADVVLTNADVVLTNADVTSTNADVVTIAGRLDSVQSNSETVEANLATVTSTPVAGYLAGAEANATSASASEAAAALSATEALTANPNVRISPVASSLLLSGQVALLNTTDTLGYASIAYTGTGASQDIVTGISSVDATASANGSGFWVDRSVANTFTVRTDAGVESVEGECEINISEVRIKSRSLATDHVLFDGLRGVYFYTRTNTTDTEFGAGDTLTSFNNNGFSLGDDNIPVACNASGATFIAYQTLYTHLKWGVTNHGKKYVIAFNPVTRKILPLYEGSGLAGHQIPNPLGVALEFIVCKSLTSVNNWLALKKTTVNSYGGTADYSYLNTTVGFNPSAEILEKDYSIIGGVYNTASELFSMSGFANSEIQGIYEYTGAGAGTTIHITDVYGTLKMASRVIFKAVDSAGPWQVFDNKRNDASGTADGAIELNTSGVEYANANRVTFNLGSIVIPSAFTESSTVGVKYIAIVEFDTNSDGGGSYFPKSTDNVADSTETSTTTTADYTAGSTILNSTTGILYYCDVDSTTGDLLTNTGLFTVTSYTTIDIASGTFNYAFGRDENGYIVGKEDATSLLPSDLFVSSYNGIKWVWKELGLGYGYFDYKPKYAIYDKTSAEENAPVLVDGVWMNTVGDELIVNGGFDTDTAGWTATNSTLTIESGVLKVVDAGASANASQLITAVIGETYVIKVTGTTGTAPAGIRVVDSGIETKFSGDISGSKEYEHTAVSTSLDLQLFNENGITGEYAYFDNVTVFKKQATLGTPLGKNISILPNPVMVTGETAQYIDLNDTLIENVMDDLEVVGDANFKSDVSIEGNLSGMSGFDLGQEWVNVSAERAVEITYKNETGRPIMISVSLTESYSGYYYVFVDSGNGEVRVASSQNGGAVGIEFNSSGIVVPNGGTYRVFVLDANQVLTHWAELR